MSASLESQWICDKFKHIHNGNKDETARLATWRDYFARVNEAELNSYIRDHKNLHVVVFGQGVTDTFPPRKNISIRGFVLWMLICELRVRKDRTSELPIHKELGVEFFANVDMYYLERATPEENELLLKFFNAMMYVNLVLRIPPQQNGELYRILCGLLSGSEVCYNTGTDRQSRKTAVRVELFRNYFNIPVRPRMSQN